MAATVKEETDSIEEYMQSQLSDTVEDDRADGIFGHEEVSDGEINDSETSERGKTDEHLDEKSTEDEELSDADFPDDIGSAASTSSGPTSSEIEDKMSPSLSYSHLPGDMHRIGLEVVSGDEEPDNASYE